MEFSRQEYWSGLPFPSPTEDYYTEIMRLSSRNYERAELGFLHRKQFEEQWKGNTLKNVMLYRQML